MGKLYTNKSRSFSKKYLTKGSVEAITTILSIFNSIAPPTLNFNSLDDELIDYQMISSEPRNQNINYALSNSFGFGGTNSCLVFSKYK
jgi:3-oxoacyl-[acyl-carrier-protein] synthase II